MSASSTFTTWIKWINIVKFSRFGSVKDVKRENGSPSGIILYYSVESCNRAVKSMNGKNLHGQYLEVKLSSSSNDKLPVNDSRISERYFSFLSF